MGKFTLSFLFLSTNYQSQFPDRLVWRKKMFESRYISMTELKLIHRVIKKNESQLVNFSENKKKNKFHKNLRPIQRTLSLNLKSYLVYPDSIFCTLKKRLNTVLEMKLRYQCKYWPEISLKIMKIKKTNFSIFDEPPEWA